MNIFFLHEDPRLAAKCLCDRHLSKMQLETAQLICTAASVAKLVSHSQLAESKWPAEVLYKATHRNHPSAIWARSSNANMAWLSEHLAGMGEEWQRRGHQPHKSNAVGQSWAKWLLSNCYLLDRYTKRRDDGKFGPELLTDVPLCMPEDLYSPAPKFMPMAEAVHYYRQYYIRDKASIATWPENCKPDWFESKMFT